jgi:TRAP-type C4-dicarboxylate transport system substrate-binding protein
MSLVRASLALLSATLLSAAATAATTVKLGTLVPVGTSYHKALMALGETWKKDSGGEVNLRIYAGGKAGGEAEMVGLMMGNSLQASLLTAVGLGEIDRHAVGLQLIPMGFRTLDELDYVAERLQPALEERLAQKGFVVLFWTDAGWIRFFSKSPVNRPADLQALKVFSWAGESSQLEVAKMAGFRPVPIETADIVPSLQTGLIEAVPMPPFFALASQVDVRAPHMLELNWAPIVGACVVRKEAWEKIAPETREKMMAAARKAGADIKAAGRRESVESVAAMQKRGLKVTVPTPEVVDEWRKVIEPMYPRLRGRTVPADIFDQVMGLLQEYRSKQTP